MLAEKGHGLDRRAAGADHRDTLVRELRQAAVVIAARVVVVPPGRVEGVAREVADAWDTRQLGPVRGPGGLHHEAGANVVVPVRGDAPAPVVLVPAHLRDARLEDGPVVEPEVLRHPLAVVEDLGRVGVFLLRHEAGFLEQRQVAIGLDVALRARVTVPVPRPAEIPAGVDDAEVGDAPLLQPGPGHQAAEPGADHGDVDLYIERLAVEVGVGVGIVVGIVGELGRRLDVLVLAVRANPLVPLDAVFLAQGARIEVQVREEVVQSLAFRCHRVFPSA